LFEVSFDVEVIGDESNDSSHWWIYFGLLIATILAGMLQRWRLVVALEK